MDEDSNLGREALLGGVRYGAALLPSDDRTADFYEIAVDRLASMGLSRYEISNFARPGSESRHNLKYWRLEPYTGFGVDAHSFDGTVRSYNPDSVDEYIRFVHSGSTTPWESSPADPAKERFFIGLREAAGIEPTTVEWEQFDSAIQHGIQSGVLQREGSRLRLTDRGFLISNEIFQEFVA
jgi:oxygen-independent coproporphyrinogen-3 oxidase